MAYYFFWNSSYMTDVGVVRPQPVAFSHKHHVKGLGLDCRFCHASVEVSPFAGLPPTETCMNCHSQLFTDAAILAPVRDSYETGKPIVWNRIHNLPDFVYFNHSVHIHQGVPCLRCHGNVEEMPLMAKAKPMTMSWCLDCHKHPDIYTKGKNIDPKRLQNCYECHR